MTSNVIFFTRITKQTVAAFATDLIQKFGLSCGETVGTTGLKHAKTCMTLFLLVGNGANKDEKMWFNDKTQNSERFKRKTQNLWKDKAKCGKSKNRFHRSLP